VGLSVRDIYRTLGSPRKPVAEALKALELDGRVVQGLDRQGERGPQTELYRVVN
jgi:DNA-binding GntR family transcriptional regulator